MNQGTWNLILVVAGALGILWLVSSIRNYFERKNLAAFTRKVLRPEIDAAKVEIKKLRDFSVVKGQEADNAYEEYNRAFRPERRPGSGDDAS